jgi:hypothetical protein
MEKRDRAEVKRASWEEVILSLMRGNASSWQALAHSTHALSSLNEPVLLCSSPTSSGCGRGHKSLFLILRKILGIRPELTYGHIKIVANCGHYITRGVGVAALYSSQIIGTIAKGRR